MVNSTLVDDRTSRWTEAAARAFLDISLVSRRCVIASARDGVSLESALRTVWQVDDIGQSLYDCGGVCKVVLDKIRGRHNPAVNRSR